MDGDSVEAKHGEKMIEVKIRFWTDGLAEVPGHIKLKHCWSAGIVSVPKNESHGIASGNRKPFNSLMELTYAVEQAMADAGLRIHRGQTRKGLYV